MKSYDVYVISLRYAVFRFTLCNFPKVFYIKAFLKVIVNFAGKRPYRSLYSISESLFNKATGLEPETLLNQRL